MIKSYTEFVFIHNSIFSGLF